MYMLNHRGYGWVTEVSGMSTAHVISAAEGHSHEDMSTCDQIMLALLTWRWKKNQNLLKVLEALCAMGVIRFIRPVYEKDFHLYSVGNVCWCLLDKRFTIHDARAGSAFLSGCHFLCVWFLDLSREFRKVALWQWGEDGIRVFMIY